MTSWSLTILFIHLWLSAFIALYFYSINDKSCLSKFFSYLFGPFSCSRPKDRQRKESVEKNGISNKIIGLFSKSDNSYNMNGLSKPIYLINPSDNQQNQEVPILILINQTDASIPLMSNENIENKAKHEENKDRRLDIEEAKTNEDQNLCCNNNGTYCDNKDKCNLPSSKVKSDPASWQLWIDTHVPCLILILIKISWLLYNIVAISAIVVTVIYFTYVYFTNLQVEPSWVQEIGNLHRHGINSIVAIIDILLLAYPVRLFHFVYCSLYGYLYAFVTFLYWLNDPKENIVYEHIDYAQPLKIVGFYASLSIMVFILQTFHFLAYRLKVFFKEKYLSNPC